MPCFLLCFGNWCGSSCPLECDVFLYVWGAGLGWVIQGMWSLLVCLGSCLGLSYPVNVLPSHMFEMLVWVEISGEYDIFSCAWGAGLGLSTSRECNVFPYVFIFSRRTTETEVTMMPTMNIYRKCTKTSRHLPLTPDNLGTLIM